MKKNGWYKESYRHGLAARGISTNKYYAAKLQLSPAVKRTLNRMNSSDGVGASQKMADMASKPPSTWGGEPTQEDLDAASSFNTKRGRILDTFRTQDINPEMGRTRLKNRTEFTKELTTSIRGQRPYEQVLAKVKDGRITEGIEAFNTNTARSIDGKIEQLTLDERRSLAVALAQQVKNMAEGPGSVTPGAMDAVNAAIKEGLLTKSVTNQLKDIERTRKIEERGPLETFARERAVDAGVAALDAPGEVMSGAMNVLDTEVAMAKGIYKSSGQGIVGATKLNTGTVGRIDDGQKNQEDIADSPFRTTNVAVGSEENGFLSPLQEPIPKLRSNYDFVDEVNQDNGNFLFGNKQKTLAERTAERVDELYNMRKELATTDNSWFKKGNRAFEKGDREKLIKAITKLQGEEEKLRDKRAIADQTQRGILSPEWSQSVFGNDNTTNVAFGGGRGASEVNDKFTKINDVRTVLKDSHDKTYARRRMLQFRLSRLDANVLPEQGAPDFDKIKRFGGDDTKGKFDGLLDGDIDNPVAEVFRE